MLRFEAKKMLTLLVVLALRSPREIFLEKLQMNAMDSIKELCKIEILSSRESHLAF